MKTTKSALRIARQALASARRAVPAYSCPKSPHTYTQPQLLACLMVREFLGLDYRGLMTTLQEWTELRRALGLRTVPHWTTFQKAAARFEKKTPPRPCSRRPSPRRARR